MFMSFQAYLDYIQRHTNQTFEQIYKQGVRQGVIKDGLTATVWIAWLNKEYQLTRGYAMALWKYFVEKAWINPKQSRLKVPKTISKKTKITVSVIVKQKLALVWAYWTEPKHITKWTFASSDWCAPLATNDLTVGGHYLTRMESKDGKEGFDFTGTYTAILPYKKIKSIMMDGRSLSVVFQETPLGIKVMETFEAETENPVSLQRQGWQSILNEFKKYCETNTK